MRRSVKLSDKLFHSARYLVSLARQESDPKRRSMWVGHAKAEQRLAKLNRQLGQ